MIEHILVTVFLIWFGFFFHTILSLKYRLDIWTKAVEQNGGRPVRSKIPLFVYLYFKNTYSLSSLLFYISIFSF